MAYSKQSIQSTLKTLPGNQLIMIRKNTFLCFIALSIIGAILLGISLIKVLVGIFSPVQFQGSNQEVIVSFVLLPVWVLFCGTFLYVSYIFMKAIPQTIIYLYGNDSKSRFYCEKVQRVSQILLITWVAIGICLCLWRLLTI